jgi:MFS family permease
VAVFKRAGWVSLTAVTLGALMPAPSTTFLAIATGDIAQSLHVGLGDLQWVTSAYLLGLTGSLVLAGKLGDLFGRRRIFLIGIAGVGLASLLIGVSTPVAFIIVLQAIQGVFGGFLTANSLSLQTASRFGAALGVAALGRVMAATTAASFASQLDHSEVSIALTTQAVARI